MKQLVEFRVDDESGETVLVEVDEPEDDAGVERAARGEMGKAARTIAESIDSVLPAAETVLATLRSHLHGPDEIALAFGVKFSGKLDAVIASAQGEANFQVNVTWKRMTEAPIVTPTDRG
jgi:hypothetical protein